MMKAGLGPYLEKSAVYINNIVRFLITRLMTAAFYSSNLFDFSHYFLPNLTLTNFSEIV